jgi:hypothetical protein
MLLCLCLCVCVFCLNLFVFVFLLLCVFVCLTLVLHLCCFLNHTEKVRLVKFQFLLFDCVAMLSCFMFVYLFVYLFICLFWFVLVCFVLFYLFCFVRFVTNHPFLCQTKTSKILGHPNLKDLEHLFHFDNTINTSKKEK